MRLVVATLVLLSASRAVAEPAAAVLPHVAILPLRVEGLSENEVKRIAAILRARTETKGGFTIQSQETTDGLADSAQALGIDCGLFEVDCVAQIGRVADVGWVIAGAATRLGDRVGLELRLVHVESGGLRRQITALLPIDPDAQIEATSALVATFFDAEAKLGTIDLTVTPKNASVLVDGVRRVRAPVALAPFSLPNLSAGEHELAIGEEGFIVHKERVLVAAGAVVPKVVVLVENKAGKPEPPTALEVAAPFVVAGAGALVAVGGVVAGIVGVQPYLRYSSAESQASGAEGSEVTVSDPAFPGAVAASYPQRDADAQEWSNTGQWLVWGGTASVVVGGVAIAAGVAWGSAVLSSAAE